MIGKKRQVKEYIQKELKKEINIGSLRTAFYIVIIWKSIY